MFAVIYRGFIYPERDEVYRTAWKTIADYFVQHCGALGSTLHLSVAGDYIAYSRWPNRETRDASWGDAATKPLSAEVQQAIETLKSCIDLSKPYEEIPMEVVADCFLIRT
ncbi:MAG: hypothetical protein K2Q33_06240 [Gammaproteobacteria bacterium]|nr:hypothetical protein [Gammaproteobacteria bacterium]